MTANRSALGWGVVLLMIGVLLLLRNTGVIAAHVSLWPWALLAAGAALLIHTATSPSRDVTVPVVLIAIGGVFAFREIGLLPTGVGVVPVVLIAVGVVLLAGGLPRTGGGRCGRTC